MDVRRIRTWYASPRTKLALDLTMAAAVTAYTVSLGSSAPHGHKHFDAVAVLLTIASNGPMAFRRAAPVVSLVLCVASVTAYASLGYWAGLNGLGAAVALYTIATKRTLRTTVIATLILYASTTYGLAFQDIGTAGDVVIQAAVLVAVPLCFGINTRVLADRNKRLARLSEQLRRDQEALARHEVMEERVRIARELHDIVAHHLSIIAVQAGLARYVRAGAKAGTADCGTVQDPLDTIAATSREALAEVRRLLVVLRVAPDREVRVPDSAGEAPGLSRLGDAVERVRGLGIAVGVTVTGRERRLPPGLDLCAYRVLQESLTNIVKHAAATEVEISLDYTENRLTAQIVDNGTAKHHPRPERPTGHGLTGMQERAALYGGSVVAGPRPAGGFAVSLMLPVPSEEAVPAAQEVVDA